MEMKPTLREKMIEMLERLNSRIKQLEQHIEEYKENNMFEDAMKCDIKRSQLLLVESDIRKQLM